MRLSTYFDSFGLTKAMQKQSIRFGAIYYKSWWNSWIPEYLEESRVERRVRHLRNTSILLVLDNQKMK